MMAAFGEIVMIAVSLVVFAATFILYLSPISGHFTGLRQALPLLSPLGPLSQPQSLPGRAVKRSRTVHPARN